MFRYHASYLILDLAHKCRQAVKDGDISAAKEFSKLAGKLEELYPRAADELYEMYPRTTGCE